MNFTTKVRHIDDLSPLHYPLTNFIWQFAKTHQHYEIGSKNREDKSPSDFSKPWPMKLSVNTAN